MNEISQLEEYAKCGLAHNGHDVAQAKEWADAIRLMDAVVYGGPNCKTCRKKLQELSRFSPRDKAWLEKFFLQFEEKKPALKHQDIEQEHEMD